MIYYYDETYDFFEIFNDKNGTLIRSDIHGQDPWIRSFPELIDVGIMGHCVNNKYCFQAGIDCYQKGISRSTEHMTVADFRNIVEQASGKTFQIALGGAGDPNKHPHIEEILKICREHRIVPNLTTSGFELSDKEIMLFKKYCGAVAISWYSRLIEGKESNEPTVSSVERLVQSGCITNVHYVVSNKNLEEAIIRLKEDIFPDGINAVIFILYKAVGEGVMEKQLNPSDPRLDEFLYLAMNIKHPYKIGFDTCFTPAILNKEGDILLQSVDACEAATFSMYIDSNMQAYPCSFGIWKKNLSVSLRDMTIQEAWNSNTFRKFRESLGDRCSGCCKRELCHSGCHLQLDINLCGDS